MERRWSGVRKCFTIVTVVLAVVLFGRIGQIMSPTLYYISGSRTEGWNRVKNMLGILPIPFSDSETSQREDTDPASRKIAEEQLGRIREWQQDILLAKGQAEPDLAEGGETPDAGERLTPETASGTDATAVGGEPIAEGDSVEVASAMVHGTNNSDMEWRNGLIHHSEPLIRYDLTQFTVADNLLREFYTVDPTTAVTEAGITWENLNRYDLHVEPGSDLPQILIYHTHSQEGYIDSRPDHKEDTVVGAGEKLAELLRGYGYSVLHDTGEYDVIRRNDAYYYAADALEQILAENPSIEVVIDLHRDEMPEGKKLVTQIDGKDCAMFMFFNGLSYDSTSGPISYLKNPNLAENLAFSLKAQMRANEYYPGLTRKIYLRKSRYNMHYRGKSMLIELGAQTNTVEEAMNAVEPLSHIIALTLGGTDS